MYKKIPRIIIAATQSGSGKTTIVTGIIAALKARGLKVQSYKVGPDYIDTGYHSLASGLPTHNLDTWLVSKNQLKNIFEKTSVDADIAIIEGVMGLYDGGKNGISSTAEVAKLLNAPVVLVIDVKSMGVSAAAIALGFREYDKEVNISGVILNRVGSDTHKQMIEEALSIVDIKCFGAVKRDKNLVMPERHLGLLPTIENKTTDLIKNIGDAISNQVNLDSIIDVANFAEDFEMEINEQVAIDKVCKIGVAKDEAFSFYYPESLNMLKNLGAEIIYFSPLHDEKIPDVDGLIIGGGFPEMFANELEANFSIKKSIQKSALDGMPIFAECGGYMYLMNELIDFSGKSYKMVGIINNSARMNEKLQMVGYVEAKIMSDCVIGEFGDIIHAHEFHFSSEIKGNEQHLFQCTRVRNGKNYFAGYYNNNIAASYLHMHFFGYLNTARRFIESCRRYREDISNE